MMKETRKELTPFRVRMMCECGGEFICTGVISYLGFGKRGIHKCRSCQEEQIFDKEYPHIEYKEKDENP